MIKQQFATLLGSEMDRKDFLKYSGGVLLAAVGVTGMIRLLLNQSGVSSLATQHLSGQAQAVPQASAATYGYGGSAYGR